MYFNTVMPSCFKKNNLRGVVTDPENNFLICGLRMMGIIGCALIYLLT